VAFFATGEAAESPNFYELWGKHVRLSYSTRSLSGVPMLHYQNGKRSWDFKGDEIRVASSELGEEVSVTLQVVPDLQSVTLTVLIPGINLVDSAAPFGTEAITTLHRTSIGGPALVKGPLQQYSSQTLHGQARRVAFFGDEASSVKGVATQSPCPGPEVPGQSCSFPLASATVQLLDGNGKVVAWGLTDALGAFNIPVKPGQYLVHVAVAGALPRCADTPVVVAKASQYVAVSCDSGLR